MKVVLLKDVSGVGRKNEVETVSDGYALNLLIPKKLAVAGTPATIAHAERLKSEGSVKRKIQEDLLLKNLATLDGVVIEMSEKANEQGHLFAGIHANAIAAALKKQKGIDLLPEFLVLHKPVKEVGERIITVKAHDRAGKFALIVKPTPP